MRSIWFKIHWFLGLLFSLFLIVIALSGATLSFEKEIMQALNKTTLYTNETVPPMLPSTVLIYIKKAYPEATITAISFFSDGSLPVVKLVDANDKTRQAMHYTINPHSGAVSPLIGEPFFNMMLDVHRRWMMGTVGKTLVGLTTIALLILLLSGVALYWGKLKRHFFTSLQVDFKKRGRGFIYQLHSAAGMWLLPWYLLLCLTGLYWSYDWYKNALHTVANVALPMKQATKAPKSVLSFEKIDQVWHCFVQEVPAFGSATLLLTSVEGIAQVNYFDTEDSHSNRKNTVMIETQKMQVRSHERYQDQPLAVSLLRSMLSLHSGEFFGWVGRISVFVAAIGMLLFVLTGWILYLKRRKR